VTKGVSPPRDGPSWRKELEEAEGKVEILLRQNGKLQPEPYEPAERAQAVKK
jgi:hypothetical protein